VAPDRRIYVGSVGTGVRAGQFPGYTLPTSIVTGSGLPLDLAVNAAGTTGYVARGSFDTGGGNEVVGVVVLNLSTNTAVDVIPVTGGDPLSVALSPDESTLIVGTSGGLRLIDLGTKLQVLAVDAGSINAISRHPTQPLFYATVAGGPILEIDAAAKTVVRTLEVGAGTPQGTAVSPDGKELYVANEFWGDLKVWDLTTNQLKASVPSVGGFGLALNPGGEFIYVAVGDQVKIFDRVSLALVRTVTVGGGSRRIAFDPVTGIAIVTNEAGWVDFVK
jgi:DNA-binding beta-propeller fold protein YncE